MNQTSKQIAVRRAIQYACAALPLLLAGCGEGGKEWKWDWWNPPAASTRPAGTLNREDLASFGPQRGSPAIEGTVGSTSYLQGARLMRVRGFGLVIGLGDKGSRNVRPSVKDQVIRELRTYRSANPHTTRDMPTAEQQLESLDSAVVEVLA